MATGDLTTVVNVKKWLGNLDVSEDDALLSRLVSMASAFVRSYLNRDISSQSYTETYDGTGGIVLSVPNYPITAVSSLIINNITIPAATNSITAGYSFDSGRITLYGYTFSRGKNNVTVTYTAGFPTTPLDIEEVAIEIVGLKYREMSRIGETTKSVGQQNISFFTGDIPPLAKTILAQYKRYIPA